MPKVLHTFVCVEGWNERPDTSCDYPGMTQARNECHGLPLRQWGRRLRVRSGRLVPVLRKLRRESLDSRSSLQGPLYYWSGLSFSRMNSPISRATSLTVLFRSAWFV